MASKRSDENIYLRGKTYYCRVQINGRDDRVSLRTGDLATARRERDRILREAGEARAGRAEGGEDESREQTWEQAVVAYGAGVLDRPGTLAPTTAERYRDSLRVVGPLLTGRRLSQIDNRVIGRFVQARQQAGKTNATIRRDLNAVARVIRYAAANGVETRGNAALDYDRGFIPENNTAIIPPGDSDVELAARLVGDAHPQWPLLVRWLRATGMRLTETLAAHRDHMAAEGAGGAGRRILRLTITKPKGARRGRIRTIVLPPAAVAMLGQLGPGRLFDHFHPDRSNNVSTQWMKFRESREGMPRFRLHDLRHAYAVAELRANPTALYRISRHLGHTTVAITERYYLRFLSEEQQYAARFGTIEPTPAQKPAQAQAGTDAPAPANAA